MLGSALYYPHIDIHDTAWLRSAMLFWDEVQTIVPTSIENPYQLADTKICAEEGYLQPLRCDLYGHVLLDLESRVLKLMSEPEWSRSICQQPKGPMEEALIRGEDRRHEIINRLYEAVGIHPDRMPPELRASFAGPTSVKLLSGDIIDPRLRRMLEDICNYTIHPEKMPVMLRNIFKRNDGGGSDRLLVDRRFAEIYMSALAASLAKELGVSPLTNEKPSSGVNLRCLGDDVTFDGPHVARGALVSIVMEGLRVDPQTPIDQILKFRQKRRDQLAELSGQFDELKKSIETSEEGHDIEENAKRIFENEIRPALGNLKTELQHQAIQSAWSGFQAASAFSAVPSTALWATGVSAPVALGIGACIIATGIGIKSYLARSKTRSASPYTYLLDVERKFAMT